MRKITIAAIMLLFFGLLNVQVNAQIASTSDNIVARPSTDRVVPYSISAAGVAKPFIWGLDLAWLSEHNVRRGIAFMGKSNVGVIRSSFMPTNPLLNGTTLQGDALTNTNLRIDIIKRNLGTGAKVVLNSDHPSVDSYFKGNAANWAKLIEVTAKMHEAAGFEIVTVSPFNEPDFSATGQGTINDFYNICGELKNNSYFNNIRISGGNTLNPDFALTWYNTLKSRLDEGNTHQLAGTFDNYANFYKAVVANGDHATNDELHNVMECMVGAEYGMQTGIWWGTAEYARGEFCKISNNGVRLAYAEHRPNWTSAAVYKTNDGKIQAFGGTSERQASTTTYNFISKDKPVYYDGQGPFREFVLEMPGGTGYQTGQTNAECVVNITYGDDIQPVIDGIYKLVNRKSGKVMEVAGGSSNDGANIQQGTYSGQAYQKWEVKPVSSRIGGDFSYYQIKPAFNNTKTIDVVNFSLDNGSNIHQWTDAKSGNQQWYLDYAGDGYFYIRSRESALCIDVMGGSTSNGADIAQWEKNGQDNQQWRLLPIDAPIEFTAPAAPTNLVATAQASSVKLNWFASPDSDLAGYTIFRSESAAGEYNTIARNVSATSFIDNTALTGVQYFYKIRATDKSLNRSAYSNQVSATATGANDLVAKLEFNSNTLDKSINLNHSALYGAANYVNDLFTGKALVLNGSDNFVQLAADIANHQQITIGTWVKWDGGNNWQRIFDFGNDQTENMFLTPKNGSGNMQFSITKGGTTYNVEAPALIAGVWTHVAVTLGTAAAKIYVNGAVVGQGGTPTVNPMAIKPILNYIGRSQWPDPLLKGTIDDFRVYNYELSAAEVAALSEKPVNGVPVAVAEEIIVSQGKTVSTLVNGGTSVLANDSDPDNQELLAIVVDKPTHGYLTLNPNGTFSYNHDGTISTSDSFTYKANDGISDSNIVTVNITITDFEVAYNNFNIAAVAETCSGKKNGQINVTAAQNFTYSATVNGKNYNFTNKNLTVSDLAPGSYEVCIAIGGKMFNQCFNVTIDQGVTISGKTMASSDKLQVEIESGTAPYQVMINGQLQFETSQSNFDVAVNPGDLLEVKTAKDCEGVLSKKISVYDVVKASPNPTSGEFDIYLSGDLESASINIYNIAGQLISAGNYPIVNGKIHLSLVNEAAGIYLVKVDSEQQTEAIKIIKK